MERSQKAPSIAGDGPYMDLASAISFQQFAVSRSGAMILRLSPALPSHVDEALQKAS